MSVGFRPTATDEEIIQAHKRPGETTSEVLRRALRALDREKWQEQARADMERIAASGEDLSEEPDEWGFDANGRVVDLRGDQHEQMSALADELAQHAARAARAASAPASPDVDVVHEVWEELEGESSSETGIEVPNRRTGMLTMHTGSGKSAAWALINSGPVKRAAESVKTSQFALPALRLPPSLLRAKLPSTLPSPHVQPLRHPSEAREPAASGRLARLRVVRARRVGRR
ncbi:hypothetical protein [Streptomyces prasinus]